MGVACNSSPAGFSRRLFATSFSWWAQGTEHDSSASFGKKQLPWVLDYIKNQKDHHASGRIQDRLERVSMDDDGAPLDG